MTSHVDPQTLALFAEGLLDKDQEEAVRACLADSEEARAQLAALAEVPRLLAAAPMPPMPDGLIERIDQALLEESKKHTAPAKDDHPPPSDDRTAHVVPFRPKRGLVRWMPYLVAAVAAVFVLGAGTAALNGLFSPATTGSVPDPSYGAREPEAALPHQLSVVSSGIEYTAADLTVQGSQALDHFTHHNSAAAPQDGAESNTPTPERDGSAELSSCVTALDSEGGTRGPVLVDIASYEGAPAWVMFFPVADGAGRGGYELRVVEPSCAVAADPADSVIATATVPTE